MSIGLLPFLADKIAPPVTASLVFSVGDRSHDQQLRPGPQVGLLTLYRRVRVNASGRSKQVSWSTGDC